MADQSALWPAGTAEPAPTTRHGADRHLGVIPVRALTGRPPRLDWRPEFIDTAVGIHACRGVRRDSEGELGIGHTDRMVSLASDLDAHTRTAFWVRQLHLAAFIQSAIAPRRGH